MSKKKSRRQRNIEAFKQILDSNLLKSTPGRDPKVRFVAPKSPGISSPELPDITSSPGTPRTDLAQYILAASSGAKLPSRITGKEGAEMETPGLLSRIFDAASGPLYGSYEALGSLKPEEDKSFMENLGDELSGIGRGIAGGLLQTISGIGYLDGERTEFGQKVEDTAESLAPTRLGHSILEEQGVKNPWAKYGLGFAMDIAADPLTYVPVAGFGRFGQKAKKAADQLTEAAATGGKAINNPKPFVRPVAPKLQKPSPLENFTVPTPYTSFDIPKAAVPGSKPIDPLDAVLRIARDDTSMDAMMGVQRSDKARRAANIRWGNPPDMLPKTSVPMSISERAAAYNKMMEGKLAKAGKVADHKGRVSMIAVGRVIDDIEKGAIPRFAPEVPEAVGKAAEKARLVADDYLTNRIVGKGRRDMNPANQANLYNRLYQAQVDEMLQGVTKKGAKKPEAIVNSPKNREILHTATLSALRTAENHIIALGKPPVYWNGMQLRLSDVLAEVGYVDELPTKVVQAFAEKSMDRIKDAAVADAIHKALARRALSDADLMENITNYAVKAKENILTKYNYPKAVRMMDTLPENARQVVKEMGLTEKEQEKVMDLVRHVIDEDKLPAESFMDSLGEQLQKALHDGRLDAETYGKFLTAITKSANTTATELSKNVVDNKFLNVLAVAFSTNIGRGPMKKVADGLFASRETNAVHRAHWFRDKAKRFTPEQQKIAFMAATNRPAAAALPMDDELRLFSNQIREYFESTFGKSGFAALRDSDNTTAMRSRMVMEDVNKELRVGGAQFQFTDAAKVKTRTGEIRNYSKDGLGWTASWELANPKDVLSFMYDMDLAVERVVAIHSLLDSAAASFGAIKGMSHFDPAKHTYQVGHHVLENVRFPKEIGVQIDRLLRDIDKGVYRPGNQAVRWYSRGLRAWKTGVTIYLPSHHIRNMIGDLHLMWWAGHNDPRDFIRASRVMQANRRRYKDAMRSESLNSLEALISKDAMTIAKTDGTSIILKGKNGTTLNASEIYVAAHQRGLLIDANKLEDIFGDTPLMSIGKADTPLKRLAAQPLGGKAHTVATQTAEAREHYVRLSHFIAATKKGMKKPGGRNLEQIMDDAAAEVRKWHPDGRDLTQFEQRLRLLIPFYSWNRKAFPLVVQAFAQRPAKVLYYPKAMVATQGLMGIDNSGGMLDPFPNDQLFPEWIRERAIGPIGDPESDNFASSWWGKLGQNSIGIEGQETGYTVVNPSNPFQDLISETFGMGNAKGLAQGLLNMSTPAFKIPAELGLDRTALGIPISEYQGYRNYLASQVPILSPINNVAEIDFRTMQQKERPATTEQGTDFQALINYLTALGVRGTGPFQTGAEIELGKKLKREK